MVSHLHQYNFHFFFKISSTSFSLISHVFSITIFWLILFLFFHLIPSALGIRGYVVVYFFCQVNQKNGGVSIFVRESLATEDLTLSYKSLSVECDFECSVCMINTNSGPVCFVTVYRSPTGCFTSFLLKFECLLDMIHKNSSKVNLTITGDFICDILTHSKNKSDLLHLFMSYNLQVINKEPTRLTNHSASPFGCNCYQYQHQLHHIRSDSVSYFRPLPHTNKLRNSPLFSMSYSYSLLLLRGKQ
jgi:hypothetical protein